MILSDYFFAIVILCGIPWFIILKYFGNVALIVSKDLMVGVIPFDLLAFRDEFGHIEGIGD